MYKAVREDGTSITEEAFAANMGELRRTLEAKGYLILSVRKKVVGFRPRRGASQKDFLIFCQEFMTLVKAGLPIVQALEILHRRMSKPAFKAALSGIIEAVRSGSSLSDAMAGYPTFFPPLFTSTIRAGEQSGSLVDVLRRSIEYQKRMIAIRRKLVTSLAYPLFLVIALAAVLTLFFLYIIPNFTQMYSDQAGELPFLTSLLIGFTRSLSAGAPIIALCLVGIIIGVYLWKQTDSGRNILDRIKLSVPLVRTIITQYIMAQLTRTLATVLRGGIPLVQALEVTAGVIGNRVIGSRLAESKNLVTEGVSLAEAFERTKLAPDMTVRMIEVGESSGDLTQMLEDISDFYEQEVENRLTVITTMIEPVLMLIMGVVIAVIVVALYLPIFEMGAKLK